MDFHFYDYLTPAAGPRQVLIPFQRVARRLLRPMFHRLRDLLQNLYDRQEAQEAQLNRLVARIVELETAARHAAVVQKAEALDALALRRRLALLEDQIAATPPARPVVLEGKIRIDGGSANRGPKRFDHAVNDDKVTR